MARWHRMMRTRRDIVGRLLFEVAIVFVGVTAAFALEGWREGREEARYRSTMIAAMVPLFDDFIRHNRDVYAVEPQLAAFERDVAAGKRPMIPVFRERGSERAPSRSWDGIVATGIPRALPPALYMDLSLFFTRQESLSERYVRYIAFVDSEIEPRRDDPAQFYDPETGRLKTAYAASVANLRRMIAATRFTEKHGRELKDRVQQLSRG